MEPERTAKAQMQRKIKRRNTQEITFFGLIWKKNKSDLRRSLLREDDSIRRSKDGQPSPMKPTCCLCLKPYCPVLMYIRCERCSDWFHGDALELEEAMVVEVVSYRCCRCRRQALPRCPHSDDYYCKRRFGHMMHAFHGTHLVVVPADDWTLWMMCPHQLPQWRPTLTKTKLSYFTKLDWLIIRAAKTGGSSHQL